MMQRHLRLIFVLAVCVSSPALRAQQAPAHSDQKGDRPNRGDGATDQGPDRPDRTPSDVDKLRDATRTALKSLNDQIVALRARVAKLEAAASK
jgi:TolA-binding protein